MTDYLKFSLLTAFVILEIESTESSLFAVKLLSLTTKLFYLFYAINDFFGFCLSIEE